MMDDKIFWGLVLRGISKEMQALSETWDGKPLVGQDSMDVARAIRFLTYFKEWKPKPLGCAS